jgi:hypothetical protein
MSHDTLEKIIKSLFHTKYDFLAVGHRTAQVKNYLPLIVVKKVTEVFLIFCQNYQKCDDKYVTLTPG